MSRLHLANRKSIGTRLARAGVLGALRPLHDGVRKPVVVLAYHRVMPTPDVENYPFDTGLLSATPEEFDWQMRLISRDFDPIALSDIASYLRGRFALPKRPIVVTFDDGYDDNFYHAFPILKHHGVPATIFATVGLVGTSDLHWHDWAAYLVLRGQRGEIPTVTGPQTIAPSDTIASRRLLVRRFLQFLKTRPHAELLSILSAIKENTTKNGENKQTVKINKMLRHTQCTVTMMTNQYTLKHSARTT